MPELFVAPAVVLGDGGLGARVGASVGALARDGEICSNGVGGGLRFGAGVGPLATDGGLRRVNGGECMSSLGKELSLGDGIGGERVGG